MLIVERCFVENIHQTSTFSVFMIFRSKSYLFELYTQLALDYPDFDSKVFEGRHFFSSEKLLDVREVIEKYGFSLWSDSDEL